MTLTDTARGSVVLHRDGDVAHVVLSSPETDNALSLALSRELRDLLLTATSDSTVRTVVLRSEGRRFSVGGDLRGFQSAPLGANLCDAVARPLHDAIEIMTSARQPVVCAAQGAVGGGAMGLVLAADIVVAAQSTVFRMGYTGSGLSPDCGVTWFLPRVAGYARSFDLLLTNRRFGTAEALELGMVSRIAADNSLGAEVDQILAALRRVPVETLAATKRLIRRSALTDLHGHLDDEAVTIGRIGDTPDAREAIDAFLDKRPPRFSR
ncbi:MAG: enoyl-CoA hydratase/isomerase family protein [Acidimicrobiales bacterium]